VIENKRNGIKTSKSLVFTYMPAFPGFRHAHSTLSGWGESNPGTSDPWVSPAATHVVPLRGTSSAKQAGGLDFDGDVQTSAGNGDIFVLKLRR
jgi:hypothetical protein